MLFVGSPTAPFFARFRPCVRTPPNALKVVWVLCRWGGVLLPNQGENKNTLVSTDLRLGFKGISSSGSLTHSILWASFRQPLGLRASPCSGSMMGALNMLSCLLSVLKPCELQNSAPSWMNQGTFACVPISTLLHLKFLQ